MDENEKLENDTNKVKQGKSQAQQTKGQMAEMGKDLAKKVVQKAAKNGVKNQVVGQALTGVFSALAPYIGIAILVILIIIILIGIIGFLITIPGMMKDKLNAFATSVGDWWKDLYKNAANVSVKDEDVVSLANYIADMGYDLIGFGFITPDDEDHIYTYESLKAEGYSEEENDDKVRMKDSSGNYFNDVFIYKDGRSYNGKTGERMEASGNGSYTKYGITYNGEGKIDSPNGLNKVNSTLLRKYAISNARNSFLRNEDDNNNIINFLHDSILGDNDPYDQWSKGLIYLYDSKDFLATGRYKDSLFESIEMKDNGKTMSIKKGFNNALEFKLDGWSGRYGLSQDFLISLHLATLSPELVQTMVQTFDTEVQVYLDEVKAAKANVKMVDTSSKVIGIPDGKDYQDSDVGLTIKDFTDGKVEDAGINIDDNWLDIDGWWISRKEAAAFYYLSDMDSPIYCYNGYDKGLPDFVLNEKLKDIAPSIYPSQGFDYYFANDEGVNVTSEIEQNVRILAPHHIRTIVYSGLHNYTGHGFSYENFQKQVHMEATGDTAVKELIPQNYANQYSPDTRDDTLITYEYEFDLCHDGDFGSLGNTIGTLIITPDEPIDTANDDDFSDDFDEAAYNNIYNKLHSDYPDIMNNYSYLKYHPGSECIYDRGLPVVKEEGAYSDYGKAYFSHIDGGFCNCEFCRTFYNKYTALQCFVNFKLQARMHGDETERAEYHFDLFEDVADIDYYDNPNHPFQAISYLYEWEDENEGETYRIAFYYNEADDSEVGNGVSRPYGGLSLVVCKAWNEQEAQEAMKDIAEHAGCSDEVKDADDLDDAKKVKVCSACKRYVKYIVWSMKKVNDNDYNTYVPYIARVVNSWFRDTFFIIPESGDVATKKAIDDFGYKSSDLTGENIPVIQNDDEFLKETGELWTKYAEYMGNPAIVLIDSNGNYLADENAIDQLLNDKGVSDEDKAIISKYINRTYHYSDSETGLEGDLYGLWIVNPDEEKQKPEEKQANELLKEYNIALIKYPLFNNVGALEKEGVVNSDIAWNAYGNGADSSKWQEVDISGNDVPYYMKHVRDEYNGVDDDGNAGELNFYVELKGVFNFVQVADAQRGMTNPKIKALFKNKKYYKYDGSTQRAYEIYNDWQDCAKIFGSEKAAVNAIDNYYYENKSTTTSFARDLDGDGIADIASSRSVSTDSVTGNAVTIDDEITKITSDPRNPGLIDNIDLNLESLSAFSILENTPSADAEYAYRDLKELIVELDYFDKEDLVEPPKDILEWILPDAGSAGWPYRIYDKSIEYGTLVHSANMYNDFNDIIQNIDTEITSGDPGSTTTANLNNTQIFEENPVSLAMAENNTKITRVSSRSESINGVTQEDVNPADYGEDGFKTITTVNGVSYKDYKQNNSIAPSEFARNVGGVSCGPTSTAVVLSAYGVTGGTGKDNLAWKLYGLEKTNTNGTVGSNIEPAMEAMGVQATTYHTFDSDIENIMDQALSEGKPMVVNVRAGSYSPGGHYIAVLGYDDQKNLVISNPCGTGLYGKTSNYTQGPVSLHEFVTKKLALAGQSQTITIPDEVPSGFNKNKTDTVKSFVGFEKGSPIVSPATAKILEIGTVTVNNETAEKYMSSFYTAEDEQYVEDNYGSDEDSGENKKVIVTKDQYNDLQTAAEEKEADPDSPFGKSYTTGYVKLEIIGSETLEKFKALGLDEYYEGLNAFYEEYYNKANNRSVCDSYVIYIEGIDLTGDLEDEASAGLNADLSNTILAGLFNANNEAGATFEVATDSNVAADKEEPEAVNEIEINYYTPKEIPKYYSKKAKAKIEKIEELKASVPAIIKLKNTSGKGNNAEEIYIKAGTTLGVTGDANIKIIMKNKKNEVVENVEEYMEIEEFGETNHENYDNDVLPFYFIPYEGGCLDGDWNDPDGVPVSGLYNARTWVGSAGREVGIGIIQWTTTPDTGMNNIANEFVTGLYNLDNNFCSELGDWIGKSGDAVYNDLDKGDPYDNMAQKGSKLKSILIAMDEKDHDRLIDLEIELATTTRGAYLDSQGVSWLRNRHPAVLGTYYSLLAFGPNMGWQNVINENMSDEKVIEALLQKAFGSGSTAGSLDARWSKQRQLALDWLDGKLTNDQILEWIYTHNISSLPDGGAAYK